MNILDILYWSLLLSPERNFYIVVNYNPHIVTKFFPKNEVRFISTMCLFFKMYQLSIFYLYFINFTHIFSNYLNLAFIHHYFTIQVKIHFFMQVYVYLMLLHFEYVFLLFR